MIYDRKYHYVTHHRYWRDHELAGTTIGYGYIGGAVSATTAVWITRGGERGNPRRFSLSYKCSSFHSSSCNSSSSSNRENIFNGHTEILSSVSYGCRYIRNDFIPKFEYFIDPLIFSFCEVGWTAQTLWLQGNRDKVIPVLLGKNL